MIKLATFRGTSPDGDPLARVFHKGDSIKKVAGVFMPEIQDWLKGYVVDPNQIAVLVNAMGASEFWGQNVNGDVFPHAALIHDCRRHPSNEHPVDDFTGKVIPAYGYWTFLHAHPFMHHKNKDPNRAFGRVALAVWNPRMYRVELVVLIDRRLAMQHGAQGIVDRIENGEYPDVSMGCKVPYDVCTVCGHKSKTRHDYCTCIKQIGMGKILDDGRRIGVVNDYPRFFDISFVFIGADKTAKMMAKLGSAVEVPIPLSADEGAYIYGDEDELVKAASVADHNELIEVGTTDSPSRADIAKARVDSAAGAQENEHISPLPEDTKELILGREDPQQSRSAIEDGYLDTTMKNEFDKEDSAAEKKGADPLSKVWEEASKIKIGPPPERNRKEFPFVGTIDFRGIEIDVENVPGSWRTGPGWKTLMKLPYGEFTDKAAKGMDRDKLDAYVGPYRGAPNVYIIHQNHIRGPVKGQYDEDKVMLGFQSPEQAKAAYLAHYDSDKYFRSVTTMAFPLFKRALMGGQFDEEKVAGVLDWFIPRKPLRSPSPVMSIDVGDDLSVQKVWDPKKGQWKEVGATKLPSASKSEEQVAAKAKKALADVDNGLELENLFNSPNVFTRRRTWREHDGSEFTLQGPGFTKAAAVVKEAMDPRDILKLADSDKWAEIIKEVGPSRATGKVTPLLNAGEKDLPPDLLDEMASKGMAHALATPSLMGMVLKPSEFQHICLNGMGHGDLAKALSATGSTFAPAEGEHELCDSLGMGDLHGGLLSKLIPFLSGKSYFGPPVRRRIIRIVMVAPKDQGPAKEVDSPLLSKVGAAYNWYRREQMKLATLAPRVVEDVPELSAAVHGYGVSDLFSKSAQPLPAGGAGMVLGSVPLSLMYSAHLRGEERMGERLSGVKRMMAHHPWITSLGAAAGIRQVLKHPMARGVMQEVFRP